MKINIFYKILFLFSSIIFLPTISYLLEKITFILFPEILTKAIFVSPFYEETLKLFLFLYSTKKISCENGKTKKQNEFFLLLSIGFLFGLSENILYSISTNLPNNIVSTSFSRIFTAQILHSAIPLYFLLLKNKNGYFLSFLFPIILHEIWNTIIYFELNFIFVYLFALILFSFVIYKFFQEVYVSRRNNGRFV